MTKVGPWFRDAIKASSKLSAQQIFVLLWAALLRANNDSRWRRPTDEECEIFEMQCLNGKSKTAAASISRSLRALARRGLIVHAASKTDITESGLHALSTYEVFWEFVGDIKETKETIAEAARAPKEPKS